MQINKQLSCFARWEYEPAVNMFKLWNFFKFLL